MNSQSLDPRHWNYPNPNFLIRWHFSMKKREKIQLSQTLIIISSLQKLAIWDHHLSSVASDQTKSVNPYLRLMWENPLLRRTWWWKNLWNKQRMNILWSVLSTSMNSRLRSTKNGISQLLLGLQYDEDGAQII